MGCGDSKEAPVRPRQNYKGVNRPGERPRNGGQEAEGEARTKEEGQEQQNGQKNEGKRSRDGQERRKDGENSKNGGKDKRNPEPDNQRRQEDNANGLKIPKRKKAQHIPNVSVFSKIDNMTKNVPEEKCKTVADLSDYLTRDAKSELEAVRAFYKWMTRNICYDAKSFITKTHRYPSDPASVLRYRTAVCDGYSQLFEALCKRASIKCFYVAGFSKGTNYDPDVPITEHSFVNHAWNIVCVKGEWWPIDVTWGAGHMDKRNQFVWHYNEVNFLPDPDIFILSHFPYMNDDFEYSSHFQLLKKPISLGEFNRLAKPDRNGLEWGLELLSHRHCVIPVNKDVSIKFCAKDVKMINVSCNFNKKRSGQDYENRVLLYQKQGVFTAKVKPPYRGTFKLMLFGEIEGIEKHQGLVSYEIECVEADENPNPYPDHFGMWGPQPDAVKFGFHEDIKDVNVFVSDDGNLKFSIPLRETVDTMVRLQHSERSSDLDDYVTEASNDKFMAIVAKLPYSGYYNLHLYACDGGSSYKPVAFFFIKCIKGLKGASGFKNNSDARDFLSTQRRTKKQTKKPPTPPPPSSSEEEDEEEDGEDEEGKEREQDRANYNATLSTSDRDEQRTSKGKDGDENVSQAGWRSEDKDNEESKNKTNKNHQPKPKGGGRKVHRISKKEKESEDDDDDEEEDSEEEEYSDEEEEDKVPVKSDKAQSSKSKAGKRKGKKSIVSTPEDDRNDYEYRDVTQDGPSAIDAPTALYDPYSGRQIVQRAKRYESEDESEEEDEDDDDENDGSDRENYKHKEERDKDMGSDNEQSGDAERDVPPPARYIDDDNGGQPRHVIPAVEVSDQDKDRVGVEDDREEYRHNEGLSREHSQVRSPYSDRPGSNRSQRSWYEPTEPNERSSSNIGEDRTKEPFQRASSNMGEERNEHEEEKREEEDKRRLLPSNPHKKVVRILSPRPLQPKKKEDTDEEEDEEDDDDDEEEEDESENDDDKNTNDRHRRYTDSYNDSRYLDPYLNRSPYSDMRSFDPHYRSPHGSQHGPHLDQNGRDVSNPFYQLGYAPSTQGQYGPQYTDTNQYRNLISQRKVYRPY